MDTIYSFRVVSTKPGQDHMPRGPRGVGHLDVLQAVRNGPRPPRGRRTWGRHHQGDRARYVCARARQRRRFLDEPGAERVVDFDAQSVASARQMNVEAPEHWAAGAPTSCRRLHRVLSVQAERSD
jgi:hypothetical protein